MSTLYLAHSMAKNMGEATRMFHGFFEQRHECSCKRAKGWVTGFRIRALWTDFCSVRADGKGAWVRDQVQDAVRPKALQQPASRRRDNGHVAAPFAALHESAELNDAPFYPSHLHLWLYSSGETFRGHELMSSLALCLVHNFAEEDYRHQELEHDDAPRVTLWLSIRTCSQQAFFFTAKLCMTAKSKQHITRVPKRLVYASYA